MPAPEFIQRRTKLGKLTTFLPAIEGKAHYDVSGVYDMTDRPYLLLRRIDLKRTILLQVFDIDHTCQVVSGVSRRRLSTSALVVRTASP